MSQQRPGTLDPLYGQGGTAPIPATPCFDPQVSTLQVYPATAGSDGSIACCGYDPDDVDGTRPLFTRLLPDGRWDAATGHVPPPDMGEPHPVENLHYFEAMLGFGEGERASYLAVSRPYHFFDNGDIALHVAVARLTARFEPWPGFGDNGIALPAPVAPPSTVRCGPPPGIAALRQRTTPRGIDYRAGPKIGYANGALRVIFSGAYYAADGQQTEHTYLTLLDPDSGGPLPGLGPDARQSLWALPTLGGTAVTPYRAAFFSDGSFVLLGQAGTRFYLLRCDARGLLDPAFAGGLGYRELEPRGGGFGLAAAEDGRVWVSSIGPLSTTRFATLVYGFTATGEPDPGFNGGEALVLQAAVGNLRLDQLQLDAQQRLVLAGARIFTGGDDPYAYQRLRVVRLLPNGEVDNTFGDQGFFPENDYLAGANDLYVDGDSIRILSLLPFGRGAFYEVVAKLQV